ncbi:hypothetical protein ONO57_25480, partial [Salmonella enterica subsp. enterica serovar Anatum]|nr:hypothetical protein [Salmonella enterica subsp. enterica serovar Anatum]
RRWLGLQMLEGDIYSRAYAGEAAQNLDTSLARLKDEMDDPALVVITFLYFFAICPLLWIYGVTITNTFMTFWENQLQMPALNRG